MNIRKILFWTHLILGCSAALFIFLMSVTGVALTYERQMIKAAQRADYPSPPINNSQSHAQVLSTTELINIAKGYPTKKAVKIVLINEENAPIVVKDGRKTLAYLNPYTGEEMATPGEGTKIFLGKLRAFHRWLTLDGKFSETGRWVNGTANVLFVILVLSGLYLWLPKLFKSRAFKQKLTLGGNYPTKQARNYQWHNVFGFYVAPILFVITCTATFFSFKWPAEILKQVTSTPAVSIKATALPTPVVTTRQTLTVEKQLIQIKNQFPQWQSINFTLSADPTDIQIFAIDKGNGGEPQKRLTVVVDAVTGQVIQQQHFEQLSTYRKARSYIRFLHTGEVFGLVGQTIAGLASLFACLLVYTGVMLSWRRWKNSRRKT